MSRAALRNLASSVLESSQGGFDDFLANALHAGLRAQVKHPPRHYRIPISFLGDCLRMLPVELPS